LTGINKEGGMLFRTLWNTLSLSPRKKHVLFVTATYKPIQIVSVEISGFTEECNMTLKMSDGS
jgi:hypothetical protein